MKTFISSGSWEPKSWTIITAQPKNSWQQENRQSKDSKRCIPQKTLYSRSWVFFLHYLLLVIHYILNAYIYIYINFQLIFYSTLFTSPARLPCFNLRSDSPPHEWTTFKEFARLLWYSYVNIEPLSSHHSQVCRNASTLDSIRRVLAYYIANDFNIPQHSSASRHTFSHFF